MSKNNRTAGARRKRILPYAIIFIIQIAAEIFAVAEIISVNMLPGRFLAVAIAILALYTLIVALLMFFKRRRWQRVLAVVMSVIMTVAMIFTGVFIFRTMKMISGVTSKQVTSDVDVDDEPFSIYISGSDTRNENLGEGERSDVNIIMIVNPSTRHILLLNTPRDYYVSNPAGGGAKDKLTHCMIYGVDNSMKALGELYDIDVDYYGQINFVGFEKLIDEIGGITIDSPVAFEASNYPFTQFSAGEQQVNGAEALAFARERYSFSDGDNTRGSNQMQVIRAVIDKVTHNGPDILMNYGGIMDSLSGTFETSMLNGDIAKMVKMQLSDMRGWEIDSFAVTGEGGSAATYSSSEPSYVMYPDEASVNEAKSRIRSVIDGTDIPAEAPAD